MRTNSALKRAVAIICGEGTLFFIDVTTVIFVSGGHFSKFAFYSQRRRNFIIFEQFLRLIHFNNFLFKLLKISLTYTTEYPAVSFKF